MRKCPVAGPAILPVDAVTFDTVGCVPARARLVWVAFAADPGGDDVKGSRTLTRDEVERLVEGLVAPADRMPEVPFENGPHVVGAPRTTQTPGRGRPRVDRDAVTVFATALPPALGLSGDQRAALIAHAFDALKRLAPSNPT